MWGGVWTETRGGTQGRGHVTTEAAIRVMPPEATDTEGRRPPPDTRRQGSSFLGTFRGSRTCRHLDFGLRASGRHFCCCEPPGLWPQGTKHSARIHDHRATTGPPPPATHTRNTPQVLCITGLRIPYAAAGVSAWQWGDPGPHTCSTCVTRRLLPRLPAAFRHLSFRPLSPTHLLTELPL